MLSHINPLTISEKLSVFSKSSLGITTILWLIVFFILSLLTVTENHTDIHFVSDVNLPLNINENDVYENHIFSPIVSAKLKFTIESDAPIRLNIGETQRKCSGGICEFIYITGGTKTSIRISGDNPNIKQLRFDVLKISNRTSLVKIDQLIPLLAILPFIILVLWVTKNNHKINIVSNLVFSTLFLALTGPKFAIVLFTCLLIIYIANKRIKKNAAFAISAVTFAVMFLVSWKYFQDDVISIFANPAEFNLLMPLGVSYFVIRTIDTQLRWFRGECHNFSFFEFLHFVIFPGTLVAGPIDNIKDFYGNRLEKIGTQDLAYGLSRLLIGLFKKIVIADAFLYPLLHGKVYFGFLGNASGGVNLLALDPGGATGLAILTFGLFGVCFAYIDFSSYSDIAIGISRMLGYRVPENFNFPLLASNLREYWKRWHMSLSHWAFRNIYFPALIATQRPFLPIFLTMLVIGQWHIFNLSWFSWALHHSIGIYVVAELQKRFKMPARWELVLLPFKIALTVSYVALGFVFVYFSDYSTAITLYFGFWQSLSFNLF